MKYYQELEKIYSRITNIENANSILAWDIAVNIAENSINRKIYQVFGQKNLIIFLVLNQIMIVMVVYKIYTGLLVILDISRAILLDQLWLLNFLLQQKLKYHI
jgi:hypothetical protein